MRGSPLERNWVEVRILDWLNNNPHMISVYHLRDNLIPGKEETVVCTLFNLKNEGLVNIYDLLGEKMVEITGVGKSTLLEILTAHRHSCE